MRYLHVALILILALVAGCGRSSESVPPEAPKEIPHQQDVAKNLSNPVKTEQPKASAPTSHDRKLAKDYNVAEVKKYTHEPWAVKRSYAIVVSPEISVEELKATFMKVVFDKTKENPDIDAIVVFASDREQDAKRGPTCSTLGECHWHPAGEERSSLWGNMTRGICTTNDKSSHEFFFFINSKVGNPQDRPTEREFQIYDIFFAALWKDAEVSEEVVAKNVAKQLGISEKKLDEVYLKVTTWHQK